MTTTGNSSSSCRRTKTKESLFSKIYFAVQTKMTTASCPWRSSSRILTTEQMQELFYSIDRQQTDNLDMDTLSEFFSPHLGEYLNVLSALEKLNVAILKAMDTTKQEYQGSSVLGQFVTRFLLRETNTQLQSLQLSLDCTMEAVDEQSCTGRKIKKPEDLSLQRIAIRPSRRIQKDLCLSPTDPYSGMLTTGVSVEPDNHHWSS
ncbi:N-terminal EF-hand calcium-binding protein 1 [Coregonus clupeaformis]|uniref:N-terminal EF-hand calcium-binding protein 1 n=1 Tax=Coregonus clupeaformis TaxID=59861 RepID=UPI001E1C65D8|nr:N-terminal EF-hand calcium-binding protein 1 [Coregonus clupeaformis]